VESRSLIKSEETRDLSSKSERSGVNNNTKRPEKFRLVNKRMFTTIGFIYKRVSILDRDLFSPATCVSTQPFVVGGESNPASRVSP